MNNHPLYITLIIVLFTVSVTVILLSADAKLLFLSKYIKVISKRKIILKINFGNEFLLKAHSGNENNLNAVIYRSAYTAEEGIFSYSDKIGADLIAVATHGRRGLSHFFFGSVGEDIANHSDIPVITFKI